jgi:hypothetical protein
MTTTQSPEQNFLDSIVESPRATDLINRVKHLCAEIGADVHYTFTNDGDMRVRAYRLQPQGRAGAKRRNVITIKWSPRVEHFWCEVYISPMDCIEVGLSGKCVKPGARLLPARVTIRPGVKIEADAFLRIVRQSVKCFREQ